MMLPDTHVTTSSGMEYALTCRAKCGPLKGWFARPCKDGVPVRDRDRWLSDEEITGIIGKNGQYVLPMEGIC